MQEAELVKKLKEHDSGALQYLYDHYGDAIFGIITRIIGQQPMAEEVLQDTFLKVWQHIDSYHPEKSRLFTWMARIARNLSIDKLRSKENKQQSKSDSLETSVYNSVDENPNEAKIDFIGLDKLIQQLPEEQQFVLNKVYFNGYSHRELAKDFDIPLGTVKTRLRTAVNLLRKKLGDL
ncbi:sigma-70 family RNA polymerase sigma factor [Limibacter armeniacum]|uniref:RNA polymerase sigma factor n=1 Tax=Limibacter armeniacum TaxID=466084 RepID=UPI002FE6A876